MDWPRKFHPAKFDEKTGEFVIDTTRIYEVYQLNPFTWEKVAEWVGGNVSIDDDGNQTVEMRHRQLVLGDLAVKKGNGIHFEPADGFYQHYAPVEE